jgi:hypothetical protein
MQRSLTRCLAALSLAGAASAQNAVVVPLSQGPDAARRATSLAVVGGDALVGGQLVGPTFDAALWRIDATTQAITTQGFPVPGGASVMAVSSDGTRVGITDTLSFSSWADPANPTLQPIGVAALTAIERIGPETRATGFTHVGFTTPKFYSSMGLFGGWQTLAGNQGNFRQPRAISVSGSRVLAGDLYWNYGGSGYGLGIDVPGNDDAEHLSPDGREWVGFGSRPFPFPNFGGVNYTCIWSEDHGLRRTFLRMPDASMAVALGQRITDDRTVGGRLTLPGGIEAGMIWHPSMGSLYPQRFDDFVASHGGPAIAPVSSLLGMVDDGTHLHFLFEDASAQDPEYHYVRTPNFSTPASPFSVYGTGRGDEPFLPPHLYGEVDTGTGGPGDTVTFHAAEIESPNLPFGVIAFATAPIGTPALLVDPQALITTELVTLTQPQSLAQDHGSYQWTIPAGTSGLSLFAQYVGFGTTSELVFSNGLRLDIQ